MKASHSILAIVLGTIAAISQTGAAQAFSFNINAGVNGPNGETNQGAFSEFGQLAGTTTVNFNSGAAPTTGFAQYSYSGTNSSVRSDVWAPAGTQGQANDSNYLAVFQGSDVTIKLASTLNYFGMDWGAISSGNKFSFYNGDTLVKSYTTEDVNPFAPVHAAHQGGEGNGYLHFYADNASEIFNKIVITQTGGGGFESDNHSFHVGTTGFNPHASVPEPGVVTGLLALGMAGVMKGRAKRRSNG
jgi:hypothetical protein